MQLKPVLIIAMLVMIFAIWTVAATDYTIEPPQVPQVIPGLIVIPDDPALFNTPVPTPLQPDQPGGTGLDKGLKRIDSDVVIDAETFPAQPGVSGEGINEEPLAIDITYEKQPSFIDSMMKLIDGQPQTNTGNVTIKYMGHLFGILPEGSPFVNIQVHQYCVDQYEYGTNAWYSCERDRQ